MEDIAKKSVKHEKYGTMGIGLAKALREYRLKVEFYCRNINGEEANEEDKKAYFDKYGDYISQAPRIMEEAKNAGVNIIEKNFTINEVIEALKQNKIIIPEINWSVLTGNGTYQGHFVVITGFDDNYIYFHNPGPHHPEENAKTEIGTMEKARDYLGTNKETIIIYK